MLYAYLFALMVYARAMKYRFGKHSRKIVE